MLRNENHGNENPADTAASEEPQLIAAREKPTQPKIDELINLKKKQ